MELLYITLALFTLISTGIVVIYCRSENKEQWRNPLILVFIIAIFFSLISAGLLFLVSYGLTAMLNSIFGWALNWGKVLYFVMGITLVFSIIDFVIKHIRKEYP